MKLNKIVNRSILIAFTALLLGSCTNLDEVILDEVLGSDASSVDGALAAAYDRLGDRTFVNKNVFAMQEFTTDVALLPTRGSDWGDGGKWRAMHEFTWTSSNAIVTDNWNLLTNGITRSLSAIKIINNSTSTQKPLFLAEAKGLLAYYTYTTLDLYGQAPYRDPNTENAPLKILKAETDIDQLILDVEAIIPDLASLGKNSTHTGRFTKEAAYSLLSAMYLNRSVFKDRYNAGSNFNFKEAAVSGTGTDMDRVIYYTSLLIDSGKFSLEKNYFDNFGINNSKGSELIFVIVQKIDNIRNGDNDFVYNSMERNQRTSPSNRGTNGSCTTPEFYHSWDNNHDDPRFARTYQYGDGTWFTNTEVGSVPASDIVPNSNNLLWFHFTRGMVVGPQYGPKLTSAGGFEMTSDGRIKVSELFMEKSTGTKMNFTPELNFDDPTQSVFAQNQINRGVRCFKWEFDPENGNGASKVDIPLFRLGGIYTMRAEAYFRKGQNAAALSDVNALRINRTREALYNNAPGKALTTIDNEILYKELGFEMYWEMYRRPQMIRFGKYDLAYTAKPVSQAFRRIFPIPQQTLDVTKEFKQNFGYIQ
ncbi:RagB/SusD family nutrient uptake outer membrane protein [Flavobacterium cellulosilyticum]|uniref:RagB/SusD family nutrient uptake outer membrane protein n=1 Tax=Flavobacterium cellulosilyticum TaxID=2541731 RepID=A0A4R5CEZ4_9FLAO|nr:RagB/SusD family nutrient uptake outer membrane protein [Flavobacterium cellulosilyticum]TDD98668.1 RagB/SusD family nutrient uptake outer membrane protein [Flavobacterium cellulosilyticum]